MFLSNLYIYLDFITRLEVSALRESQRKIKLRTLGNTENCFYHGSRGTSKKKLPWWPLCKENFLQRWPRNKQSFFVMLHEVQILVGLQHPTKLSVTWEKKITTPAQKFTCCLLTSFFIMVGKVSKRPGGVRSLKMVSAANRKKMEFNLTRRSRQKPRKFRGGHSTHFKRNLPRRSWRTENFSLRRCRLQKIFRSGA